MRWGRASAAPLRHPTGANTAAARRWPLFQGAYAVANDPDTGTTCAALVMLCAGLPSQRSLVTVRAPPTFPIFLLVTSVTGPLWLFGSPQAVVSQSLVGSISTRSEGYAALSSHGHTITGGEIHMRNGTGYGKQGSATGISSGPFGRAGSWRKTHPEDVTPGRTSGTCRGLGWW